MNIILLGYRGCGKSSIGRMLAEQLWKTFADVDEHTCRRWGNESIADIWSRHGEPEYRKVETQVTQELCRQSGHVIALGGGTLMQCAAREAVEAADAVRIYLRCDTAELFRRVSQDPRTQAKRPNLTSLGGGLQEITAVLAQREPIYQAVADKVLDVTHLNIEDATRYLIARCL